jgi:hypothetical protein
VRICSGERKDELGIAKIFLDAAIDIVGSIEQAAEFGGWCIDGTKANRSAINLLEETYECIMQLDQHERSSGSPWP